MCPCVSKSSCERGKPTRPSEALCVPTKQEVQLRHRLTAFSTIIWVSSLHTFSHLFSYFLAFFYCRLCSSHAFFPGMVRPVAVVLAVMSKYFPCSLIGGSLFPLQALGVPTAGLCPTPLTPQWVFILPRPSSSTSLHHASLIRGTGRHRGHRGTKTPSLFMPPPVPL